MFIAENVIYELLCDTGVDCRAVAMAACSGEKMDRLLITLCSFLGVCVLLLVCVLSSLLHKHKYIGGVSKLKDFLWYIQLIFNYWYFYHFLAKKKIVVLVKSV